MLVDLEINPAATAPVELPRCYAVYYMCNALCDLSRSAHATDGMTRTVPHGANTPACES